MSVFLSIAWGFFAKGWSWAASIFTYIWERPALRNALLIALAILAAFIYGEQRARHLRALADQKAAYELRIKKLEEQRQQANELAQAKQAQEQETAQRLQRQNEVLESYQQYLDAQPKQKEKVNGKTVYVRSPCAVDQRLLDALGVRQPTKR